MNVMWYVGKFDEATWNLFGRLGLTPQFLRDTGRGMAAVEQNIAYKKELMAGDIVTVHSAILEIKDRVIRFAHQMRRTDSDEEVATTTITAVHLDTKMRRATPFPAEIRTRIQALATPAGG